MSHRVILETIDQCILFIADTLSMIFVNKCKIILQTGISIHGNDRIVFTFKRSSEQLNRLLGIL
jgi:hypothetical protein